ncbi:selenocysteine-specific translation elongation factor [Corynebacterium bouchesdurhonense]|uniref:selenocysteine-specific translation elongation factor n=1 Tax=Corynebacterium bouchesdurhonense TaxID=1720192 RepID=UPI00082B8122|nr:selenocysteine-specific translation elongation factor [Corynebacterium bouchesdurhonense]
MNAARYVVATAGHVDHGKSTLVKRLTGMEPDRWEEERRRGLTIDLGFVWASLPGAGAAEPLDVAFVDVPGHERFIANMLAGVGPAPAVLLVVAADEGFKEQSRDHLDAIDAFGIGTGVVAMTRADNADAARRAEVRAEIARETAGTTAVGWPVVEVSAKTGEGLAELTATLARVLRAAAAPDPAARVRFWVDRSFSVKGAGTVVTGTLTAGTIRAGDTLQAGEREVQVRGLQSEDAPVDAAAPAMRVALNLRGVDAAAVGRGDALVTPGEWWSTSLIDVSLSTATPTADLPREAVCHIGTAGVACAVRALGEHHARLTLERPLPLALGDAVVLRGSGEQHILAGARVVDADPPAFTARGDAARRAAELPALPDISAEIARRVAVEPALLATLGYDVPDAPPQGSIAFAGYWIRAAQVMAWKDALARAVAEHEAADPLSPGLTAGAAAERLALPDARLLPLAAAAAKLQVRDGVVSSGRTRDLGEGIAKLEAHLAADPFAAPEAADLERWGVGPKELAAAERAGRVVRIADGVVLLPSALERAAALLAGLPAPFTASEARKAWGTTRRVAIPLLETLDARGVTRRVDGTARVLR